MKSIKSVLVRCKFFPFAMIWYFSKFDKKVLRPILHIFLLVSMETASYMRKLIHVIQWKSMNCFFLNIDNKIDTLHMHV